MIAHNNVLKSTYSVIKERKEYQTFLYHVLNYVESDALGMAKTATYTIYLLAQ